RASDVSHAAIRITPRAPFVKIQFCINTILYQFIPPILPSRQKQKLVAVEQGPPEHSEAVLGDGGSDFGEFVRGRIAEECDLKRTTDLCLGLRFFPDLALDAFREGGGLLQSETAVEEVQRLDRRGRFA